jgi:hypothetical protein
MFSGCYVIHCYGGLGRDAREPLKGCEPKSKNTHFNRLKTKLLAATPVRDGRRWCDATEMGNRDKTLS